MDRTVRMLRRTLLCAVLACPLALRRLSWAMALQAAATLLPGGARAVPWYQGKTGGRFARAAFSLCCGLALCAALHRLCWALLPAELAGCARPLCLLTGLMLQAALILRTQRAGKRRLAACLPLTLFIIACMR